MSQDTPNPFQSPVTPVEQPLGMGGAQPSERTMQLLMQTRPWVKLISILMFIGIGFMLLGAVFLFVAGAAMFDSPAQGVAMGGVYAVMAAFYFFPARFLMRYASHIQAFARDGTTEQLDDALEAQKSFWKFVGIIAAIVTAIYAVIFIVAIAAGGLSFLG